MTTNKRMNKKNDLREVLLNLIRICPLGQRKLWCPLLVISEKERDAQLSWVDSLDNEDLQIFIKVCQKCFTDNNNS